MAGKVNLDIQVHNQQANQKLTDTNKKAVQLAINGSSVSIGNEQQIAAADAKTKDLNKSVDQTQQKTKKVKRAAREAGQAGTKAANDTKKATQDANKELDKQSKQFARNSLLSTSSKQIVRGVNDLVQSFINPITIVLVAFEAITKTFTYFWNNLTESTSKLTTRGQNAIKVAELTKKRIQQETKSSEELLKRLEELNKQQSLTSTQQKLAESIVIKLNKQYKDLGITLDQITGKYKGLYEAQIKIDQRDKNAQVNALNKQIVAQRDIINASLKNAFGEQINIGQIVTGKEFFTIAEKMGKTLGAQSADILARKWNTGKIENQIQVIDQLLNGLSSGSQFMQNGVAVRDAMQALIDYRKQLQDLNSIDTQIIDAENRLTEAFKAQKDALKATRDQVEKLNKSYDEQQRANSLDQLDPEDRANALRNEVEQLKKKNEQLQKTQEIQEEQTRYSNLEANSDKRAFNRLNNERRDLEKQIQDLQQKRDQNIAKRANRLQSKGEALIAGNSFISKNYFQSELGIDPWKLQKDIEANLKAASGLHVNPVDPKDIEDLQQMLKYVTKYNDLFNQNTLLQAQLVKAQKQLTQLNEQAKQAEIDLSNSQTTRLQNQQKIADIEKERQENLNAIQSKEKQIADIEKQLAEERAEAELRLWQIEQQRRIDYSDFVNSLMRKQVESLNEIIGKKKDNLLLELQLNAERIKGRKLQEDELEALKSYVDVMTMQDQLKANQKLNLQTNGVITNDLARKGGWASSVVVDRSVDINRQILNVQRSQVDLMAKLNETMDRSNELLKQFSVIQ